MRDFFGNLVPRFSVLPLSLSLTPWGRVGENPGNGVVFLPVCQEFGKSSCIKIIYFFVANANQPGKRSLVSPMKASNRTAWLRFSN